MVTGMEGAATEGMAEPARGRVGMEAPEAEGEMEVAGAAMAEGGETVGVGEARPQEPPTGKAMAENLRPRTRRE